MVSDPLGISKHAGLGFADVDFLNLHKSEVLMRPKVGLKESTKKSRFEGLFCVYFFGVYFCACFLV